MARASEGSPPPRDPTRSDVVDAVLRSKGVNNIMDLDAEEEKPPLLTLQKHHDLVIVVEMCEAQRPSKLGSLKGSHEKYEEEFSRLQQTLDLLAGEGSCSFHKWEPGMGAVRIDPSTPGAVRVSGGAGGGRQTRPQSAASTRTSRPQSAMSAVSRNRLGREAAFLPGGLGAKQEQFAPRIGAFEVTFKLVNTQSHKVYGPDLLFSKIESGCWPGSASQLINRAQKSLQPWLMADLAGHSIHTFAKAEAAKMAAAGSPTKPPAAASNASPPLGATGASLPPHLCLASSLDEEVEEGGSPAAAAAAVAPSSAVPSGEANHAAAAAAAEDGASAGAALPSSQEGNGDGAVRPAAPAATAATEAVAAPVAPGPVAPGADEYDMTATAETEAEAEALEAALDGA